MPSVPITTVDASPASRPLLFVTEGILDISCLKHFSRTLHRQDATLPDLDDLADQGRVIFLPAGGGDLAAWTYRLAPLGCCEFHLWDREQEPESSLRQRLVDAINARPNCRAAVTRRRSLENYLHPAALEAVFGVRIEITNDAPVAELVACAHPEWKAAWPSLTRRAKQRLILRTKRRLNAEVAQRMTPDLFAEADPDGEVIGWFRNITALLTCHI